MDGWMIGLFNFSQAVEEVTLKDCQYTLEHVRAFAMYNYLHVDAWYDDSVLFVDCKGRVLSFTVTLDTALSKPREVFRLPAEAERREDRVCPSLSLTSPTWAALSDGAGRLYLLRTSKRGDAVHGKWEPLFTEDSGGPFVVLHSVAHVRGGAHTLEVLLLRVVKDPQETAGSGYSVTLEWITVANAAGQGLEKNYEVKTRRLLRGKSVPHYAAVTPQGDGLMVASEKPFAFTHVDGRPLEQPAAGEPPAEADEPDPVYSWQQTSDDITADVRLPEGAAEDAIRFRVTADTISVGVRGSASLLEGRLYASVDPEACTWNLREDNRLELNLQKRTEGPVWPELVTGDRRGRHVMSEEQAAVVRDRLTQLSSEDAHAQPDPDKPACDAQELEDCDGYPEETSSLVHFDGESLKTTQVVNLAAHQYLFSVSADPAQMPCLCLRHDVDALLWQPRPDRPADMWEHVATFNALGYVQASKRDKKFSTCAPNFSYASLCECLRRAFIYRQPSAGDGALFNRKRGRPAGRVARQQVAGLDSDKAVLGFGASDERLFALTSRNLFVLKVNNDNNNHG
ncbi:nudC domain-containing protein 1 isoform X2 [Syngnathoides biaculeatus]|uniref:nudC domain-containing protein 1 isoform X2 n=1 Tax=Syngnathoides biaculeatus TaxID=300417 RepID=UPI002ADE932E|nr:nudC domain-containing protein 1 isoform X2 [Syngnathoides biaculeatus]XP_061679543.1 nudC domain-containing protein 1 isoform X2 [Syngnathoides biaculeatus]XP_061679551.1 nudC domain-containing protein 1 isoform X2 [Syngnathoides biaculeatus]